MRCRGFTMLELILAITITAIIGSAVSMITYTAINSVVLTLEWGRTFERMQRASDQLIREFTYLEAGDITAVAASSMTYTDSSSQSTTIQLSSGDLMRGSEVLADNIDSLAFTYYDANQLSTSTAADVRLIGVEIIANVGDEGDLPVRFMVYPRSFAYANFQ